MMGTHVVPFHHLIFIRTMALIMSKGMKMVTVWTKAASIQSGIEYPSSTEVDTRAATSLMISADAMSAVPRMLMDVVDLQVDQ